MPDTDKPSERTVYTGPVDDGRAFEYVISGLSPSKFTTALRDADYGDIRSWMELSEMMEDRDGQIAQCLATRKAAVVACNYDVEPWRDYRAVKAKASAEESDTEIADFVRDQLFRLHCWEDRMLDLLDAIPKGTAFCEVVYKQETGPQPWRIDDIRWVPQRTMSYYAGDAPRLLTADSSLDGVPIRHPMQWVVHTPRIRSVEPWRAGLMRILGWYFIFKHADIKNWLGFLDTHAHPLRIAQYASGASQADKDGIYTAVKRIAADQAALVARTGDFDPISFQYPQTGEVTSSFEQLATYCDREIAKVVLGQTLTSDADGKGSYALGAIHNRVRNVHLAADADALCTTIRRDIIKPLVLFNFGAEAAERLPWFKIYYQEPDDLESKARTFGTLSTQLGMRFSDAQVREEFALDPVRDESDEVSPRGPVAPPVTMPVEQASAIAALAATEGDRPIGAPEATILGLVGFKLPKPVAEAVKEYAAVVDGANEVAFDNTLERVTKYLARAPEGWGSGEKFAAEFMGWWDKAWRQYWGAGGISKGTLYPFLEKMYRHYKTVDKSVIGTAGKWGGGDKRVVDFMTRADRWYFSTFTNNASFRGPMQEFLLKEYAGKGGALFGPKNAETIAAFKRAAGTTAHDLSAYEVDRILRTGVNRSRNWAGVQAMADAGIQRAQIVTHPGACAICAPLEGKTFDIGAESVWIDSALKASDSDFVSMLEDQQAAHRKGIEGGLPPHEIAETTGGPTYHPNCRCRVVMA